MNVQKVISGGQCGADVAGLRAAKFLGLETGGWIPRGFRTKLGPRPYYAETYGLQETTSDDGYPTRTARNVRESDATVRFAWDWTSAGERLTHRLLHEHGKPHFDVTISRGAEGGTISSNEYPAGLAAWLDSHPEVRVLNVAGNASPWIEGYVETFLVWALTPTDWPPYEC